MTWDHPLFWIRYTLPSGRRVFLTNRPDSCTRETVQDFISLFRPALRFQLTDDAMRHNQDVIGEIPYHWYVWVPCASLKPESVFPFLSLLTKFDQEEPVTKPVWVHCDSSSMRAPTFFGLWLRCRGDDYLRQVEKTAVQNQSRSLSSLERYSGVAMEQDPGIRELVEGWLRGGEAGAYGALMAVK